MRLCINPGHGGHDSGVVGLGGLRESGLNLDISGRVATVARGFRADVEKIVDGKLEAVLARFSALDKALSEEREERRRMEREK